MKSSNPWIRYGFLSLFGLGLLIAFQNCSQSGFETVSSTQLIQNQAGSNTPSATLPNAVTGLAATSNSQNSINLTWNLPSSSPPISEIEVERSNTSSGPFSVIATLGPSVTFYVDSGLNAGLSYFYRVRTSNSAGDSPYSLIVNGTTQAAPQQPNANPNPMPMPMPTPSIPVAPSSLAAAGFSTSQINIAWADNSNNEAGFKVERSLSSSGPFTLISTLPADTKTFSDTSLPEITRYYYRVYAFNDLGNSSPTNIATETTFATFTWITNNIFRPRCYECHTGNNPSAHYNLGTYAGAIQKVVPGAHLESIIYSEVNNDSMPPKGAVLTTQQKDAIRTWITSGAPNN